MVVYSIQNRCNTILQVPVHVQYGLLFFLFFFFWGGRERLLFLPRHASTSPNPRPTPTPFSTRKNTPDDKIGKRYSAPGRYPTRLITHVPLNGTRIQPSKPIECRVSAGTRCVKASQPRFVRLFSGSAGSRVHKSMLKARKEITLQKVPGLLECTSFFFLFYV